MNLIQQLLPSKPVIRLELDFSVPEGFAELYDANSRLLGQHNMRAGKCPPEARLARVGPEVYFSIHRL